MDSNSEASKKENAEKPVNCMNKSELIRMIEELKVRNRDLEIALWAHCPNDVDILSDPHLVARLHAAQSAAPVPQTALENARAAADEIASTVAPADWTFAPEWLLDEVAGIITKHMRTGLSSEQEEGWVKVLLEHCPCYSDDSTQEILGCGGCKWEPTGQGQHWSKFVNHIQEAVNESTKR